VVWTVAFTYRISVSLDIWFLAMDKRRMAEVTCGGIIGVVSKAANRHIKCYLATARARITKHVCFSLHCASSLHFPLFSLHSHIERAAAVPHMRLPLQLVVELFARGAVLANIDGRNKRAAATARRVVWAYAAFCRPYMLGACLLLLREGGARA